MQGQGLGKDTLELFRVDERVESIRPDSHFAKLSTTLLQDRVFVISSLNEELLYDSDCIHLICKRSPEVFRIPPRSQLSSLFSSIRSPAATERHCSTLLSFSDASFSTKHESSLSINDNIGLQPVIANDLDVIPARSSSNYGIASKFEITSKPRLAPKQDLESLAGNESNLELIQYMHMEKLLKWIAGILGVLALGLLTTLLVLNMKH